MVRIEQHLERVTAQAGEPLASHATGTVAAGGKRLRPLLVVLAAESAGGPGDSADAEDSLVRAAVAVELVHSATLVHDDVIDGAQLRRGHPSVAAAAGRKLAIATGDLLFSRAFAELARNRDAAQLRVLSDASSALAEGELLQREDAYAAHVAVARYLRRCELKTAAPVRGRLPPGCAGGRRRLARSRRWLGAFARRIGLAFQLLDDVLDVSGPVERTGKARGTDLLDGTVTLPLILARERDPELAALDLASLSGPLAGGAAVRANRRDRRARRGPRARAGAGRASQVGAPAQPARRARGLLDLVADAVVERYR